MNAEREREWAVLECAIRAAIAEMRKPAPDHISLVGKAARLEAALEECAPDMPLIGSESA